MPAPRFTARQNIDKLNKNLNALLDKHRAELIALFSQQLNRLTTDKLLSIDAALLRGLFTVITKDDSSKGSMKNSVVLEEIRKKGTFTQPPSKSHHTSQSNPPAQSKSNK